MQMWHRVRNLPLLTRVTLNKSKQFLTKLTSDEATFMVKRAIVISTLAVLAVGELTHQAIASPDVTSSTPKSAANNYVIPVQASPAPQSTAAIAPAEAIVTPEFSQSSQTPVSTSNSSAQSTQTPINSASTNKAAVLATPASPQTARTVLTSTNQLSGASALSKNASTLAQSSGTPKNSTITNDLAVTATDVQVKGATDELQQIVLKTIRTRPGGSTSQSQLDSDVAAILNTGFFSNASVISSQNRDGLNVVFQVEPVVVRSLQLSGNQVLPPEVANDAFKPQLGQPISLAALRQGAEQVSKWYKDNNYVLAQVLSAQPNRDGVVTVNVAEGVVGDINVRFLDKEGQPTQGRTKEDFINQELKLKPGQVFRVDVARQDLQHLYKLGLFDNANISLNGDARKVDVTYDLTERPARGVNVGGGYSADTGVFGTINYRDQNFGGVNKQLGLNVQIGSHDLQFDGNFTNPYRASNPDMPGYSVNVLKHETLSQTFNDNFKNDTEAANYEEPREGQIGGGVTLTKPVGEWDASVGLNYTRTTIRDKNGNIISADSLGNPVSFSGSGVDDLVAITAGVAKDQRNNPVNPTEGSILSLSTQQSIPVGSGNILMNQVKANYSQYVPVNLFGTKDPQVLAFNVQGGTTIGDLPPYMAFNVGGINSVRGYGTGDVATGRSYVLASAEYRIPIYNPVGAVLFADFGSDLGTGDSVLGDPGAVREKPGMGFGYGAGLRINSPIGIIRADYGFNDQGGSQLQFGIGQRF
jgi:outer membrane protein insertion porin family